MSGKGFGGLAKGVAANLAQKKLQQEMVKRGVNTGALAAAASSGKKHASMLGDIGRQGASMDLAALAATQARKEKGAGRRRKSRRKKSRKSRRKSRRKSKKRKSKKKSRRRRRRRRR